MYPSAFGRASQDINCRCALLQRARWALDEEELQTLKERAEYFGLDKGNSFFSFQEKYLTVGREIDTFNENIRKTVLGIAGTQSLLYNTSLDKKSRKQKARKELKKAYKQSIKLGELTPLAGFELYEEISEEIDKRLIGITTSNGIKIKSKSYHFIARVIGSISQRRNGVPLESVLLALTVPDRIDPIKENENGRSQRFILKGVCAVTVNPDTGKLIQVNPRR